MKLRAIHILLCCWALLCSPWLAAQTSYEYCTLGIPCLSQDVGFINAQLCITDPPAGAYTAQWTIISPITNTVITSDQQPSVGVQFDEPGCWSVVLEINGVVVQNDPCGVEVFLSPLAAIDPIDVAGCTPFTPVLNELGTEGSSPITQYIWDLGFCPNVEEQNIDGECIINVPGDYNVTLSVIDQNGCFDNETVLNMITVSDQPPNADFDASSVYDCNSPVDITFNSTSDSFNGDLTYNWTVDGAPVGGNDENLVHTFLAPGFYDVCLEVIDELDCSDVFCEEVEIFDTPNATFSVNPTAICAGMEVIFENESTPAPIPNIEWDIDGDGVTEATGNTVEHSYTVPGTYNAELLISYSDHCVDSVTQEVTVEPPLQALFDIDTLQGCAIPFVIQLTDLSVGTGALTYDWFIIENGVETPIMPVGGVYTFTDWGDYEVGLTLTNDIGCFDQFIFPEEIEIEEPELEFNLVAPSTCVGDIIFTDIYENESLEPFINWYYDVDCDGTVDQEVLNNTDGNTTFSFSAPGIYDVCLVAESALGCTDSWMASVTIAPEIFSDFTVSDNTPCGIDSVLFSATNPSPGLIYSWLYGDGNSSGESLSPNSLYSYCDTGYMDVTLLVSNLGCFTSTTYDSLVYVPSPIAGFEVITNCENYYTVQLQNSSILGDTATMVWNVDGVDMYIGEWEPEHTFTTEGFHTISLTVFDSETGCSDFKTTTFKINEPTFEVDIGPTTGCPPVMVDIQPLDTECVAEWDVTLEDTQFLHAEIGNSDPWDMDWNVQDGFGNSSGIAIDWPLVEYNDLGQFDISMTILDVNGCQIDTTYENIINIDIDPLFAQFDTTVTMYCDSAVICVEPVLDNLLSWDWSTNSGHADSTETPCFTFYPPYNQWQGSIITLSADLPGDCFSTVSDEIFLPQQTDACVSISDDNPCKNEEVFLDAGCTTCDVTPCTYAWDLDNDGLYDDAITDTMTISWAANDTIPIALMVTDSLGCESFWDDVIIVHTPEIELSFEETVTACISSVTLSSTTEGPGISTTWELTGFNDNGPLTPFVDVDLPGQFQELGFNQATLGVYDINVEVVNQYGCMADTTVLDLLGYGSSLGPFTCTLDTLNCTPYSVQCQAFNPDDTELSYVWNMGDNTGYTATTVDHDYFDAGDYQISLTMTDPENNCIFSVQGDEIEVQELTFDFLGPDIICPNDSALITVNDLDSLVWNTQLENITNVTSNSWFLNPVDDNVFEATGYLDGCSSIESLIIETHDIQPVTAEAYGPFCVNQGDIGLPVVDQSGGQFFWQNSMMTALNSIQLGAGLDTVTYIVLDSNACMTNTDIEVMIHDTTMVTFDPSVTCINGTAINLNGLVSPGSGLFTLSYDQFITDTTATFDPSLITAYPATATNYPVQYFYTNAQGCVSHVGQNMVVHPEPIPSFNIENACENEELVFQQLSSIGSGVISDYQWDIQGFGVMDTIVPTGIIYNGFGDYVISLNLVSDQGCVAALTDTVSIFSLPNPVFSINEVCQNEAVELINNSDIAQGEIAQVDINWGDGNMENNLDSIVSHQYLGFGGQTLVMTVTSDNNCAATDSINTYVHPVPNPFLEIQDHCFETNVLATDSSTIAEGSLDSITYQLIEDSVDYIGSSFNHIFSDTGEHHIAHQVTSAMGCVANDTVTITVHDLPVVALLTDGSQLCSSSSIVLTDNSTVVEPYTIDQVIWNVNGEVQEGFETEWYYGEPTLLIIDIDVYSNAGCLGTLIVPEELEVFPKPKSDFYVDPTTVGIDLPLVNLVDQSVGAVNWQYEVSDGAFYYEQFAQHIFEDLGAYRIAQEVTNQYGCRDSSSIVVEVVPQLIIYVPNAVTFDEDGLNDLFAPSIIGDEILEYELDIFDRYGYSIFHSTDPTQKWNGSVNGNGYYAQDGVYNWRLKVRGEYTPLEVIQGAVTVVR